MTDLLNNGRRKESPVTSTFSARKGTPSNTDLLGKQIDWMKSILHVAEELKADSDIEKIKENISLLEELQQYRKDVPKCKCGHYMFRHWHEISSYDEDCHDCNCEKLEIPKTKKEEEDFFTGWDRVIRTMGAKE